MYQTLLLLHSIFRWLVLGSLLYSIYLAYSGYKHKTVFSEKVNALRHWTATIAHIQLVLGMILYFTSPVTGYFFAHFKEAVQDPDSLFFGMLHSSMMLGAVVVLTVGSALTRRRVSDQEKYRTMLYWFSIALLLMLVAIPWPFSPLAHRPYFRAI